jgi:hypothetical protein
VPNLVLDDLHTGKIKCAGDGPCLALDLIHEWAYRFPSAELPGQCTAWSPKSSAALKDEEACVTQNMVAIDLLSAIEAFIDACTEEIELTRIAIWDHIPKLFLPDPYKDEALEWLIAELPHVAHEFKLARKFCDTKSTGKGDQSPRKIEAIGQLLEELSTLLKDVALYPDDRLHRVQDNVRTLRLLLSDFELIHEDHRRFTPEALWQAIIDWIDIPLQEDFLDAGEWEQELHDWVDRGAQLCFQTARSCLEIDIWPRVDASAKTITWLGITHTQRNERDLAFLQILIEHQGFEVHHKAIDRVLGGEDIRDGDAIRQAKRSTVNRLKQLGFEKLALCICSESPEHYWINPDLLRERAAADLDSRQNDR